MDLGRILQDGWTLTLSDADAFAGPDDIPDDHERLVASVPGTVAAALRAANRFDAGDPVSLEHRDAWYRLDLADEIPGPAVLRFAGLATVAEVFFNGHKCLTSESMFEAYDVPVLLTGRDRLEICFRAIGPHLGRTGPRARWRPRMMRSQGLRLLRTTALGFMPGWCPDVVAVGPWRPITLLRQRSGDDFRQNLALSATLDIDGTGHLTVSFDGDESITGLALACDGRQTHFQHADGRCSAELVLPGIEAWWPHTHGRPVLHEISILGDHGEQVIARTGFRRIDVDRGSDGLDFGIRINGVPVFCRGSAWTSGDIVSLPGTRADYEPWLRLAAEAGMNMIRIPGITVYETPEFFKLCDELGLMVWQDLMFANFDYPANDDGLMLHVRREIEQFLKGLQASPSLIVLCGGSEIFQQGAMLGLPERIWKNSLATDILADLCTVARADVAYVQNSPSGGALPFFPNAGVAHYYGVGAYCRPLEDARRANVRFAAECLAFSNVPDAETLRIHLPVAPSHDPRWKARVPRDIGTPWDFEDVRDNYLHQLYALDPARLRFENPERYLDFSRAVTAEVIEATFSEWRRPGSSCNGALTWTLQDLLPGPGWGAIDATGRPKSVWHALKRAFAPLQVLLMDEGTNGLDIAVLNDGPTPFTMVVELECLRDGRQKVAGGVRTVELQAHSSIKLAATDLLGAFFDTTYAYRFGPPSHDVNVARLKHAESGTLVAEAFQFPLGRSAALHAATIEADLVREEDGGWALHLRADRLAQSVTVSADGYRPSDNGFHLAPGTVKRVRLIPSGLNETDHSPSGTITSLGGVQATRF